MMLLYFTGILDSVWLRAGNNCDYGGGKPPPYAFPRVQHVSTIEVFKCLPPHHGTVLKWGQEETSKADIRRRHVRS